MLCRARLRLQMPLGLLPLLALLPLLLMRLTPVLFPTKHHVMQITMPMLRCKVAALVARKAEIERETGVPFHVFYLTTQRERQLPWQSYALIGNARHDAATLRAAEAFMVRSGTSNGRGPGVRIAFGPGARYGQVITALDLMLRLNAKKYMLDLERPEPALYVFGRRGIW